jgi:serine/threonine protein kinase/WD40 repeat protein
MQDESQTGLVSELAKEFLERCRAGSRPSLSEYTDKYPDLAEEIREVFPMMLLMEEVAPESSVEGASAPEMDLKKLGDFRIQRVIGRGGMGLVYEATQESLGRRVALKVCPLVPPGVGGRNQERFRRESRAAAMLHHTNIVPVFAVGEESGMLYYAMQFIEGATLDDVIQELNLLWRSRPTSTTRLTNSGVPRKTDRASMTSAVAKSLTRGNSTVPGSVPDFGFAGHKEFQEDSARVSLPGQASSDAGSGASTKYWESVARIGIQISSALAYAHAKGTLHRDIKPGNLMLDQSGTVWVMDFGLAKSLEEDDLTREGELVGTLRYMAPEQARGHAEPASDVYSLGLTLYELLALRPAYDELHRSELLRAIAERDPVSPRKINSKVPRDLETITMKCLEREPSKRYASAQDLLNDLNRFLAGEPILARPVTTAERVGKWVRRRPMVASLVLALATLFMTSFGMISWKWRDAEVSKASAEENELLATAAASAERRARDKADSQAALAEKRLETAQEALYRSAISRVEATSSTDSATARRLLAGLVPGAGEVDRRGWEWGYLNALVNQERLTLQAGAPQAEWIRALAFSDDERLLAVGSARPCFTRPLNQSPRGRVTVWDMRSGKLVADLPIQHSCRALAFSPDNRHLAISEPLAKHHFELYWKGPVRVWDVQAREPIVELEMPDYGTEVKDPGSRATNLAYNTDGSQIFGTVWSSQERPDKVSVWDASTGEELWSIPNALFLAYDGAEECITVVAFAADELQRFDVVRRKYIDSLPGEVNGTVARHDPRSGALAQTFNGRLQVAVAGSRGGKDLRLCYGDDGYRVSAEWPMQPIVAFHPHARRFAVGTAGGDVRIWQRDLGVSEAILRGHSADVQSLAYSKSGRWLASGDWNGEVRVWETDQLSHRVRCKPRFQVNNGCYVEAIAFRSGACNLVSFTQLRGKPGKLTSWETERGLLLEDHEVDTRLELRDRLAKSRRQVAFSPDGELVLALKGAALQLLETRTRRLIASSQDQPTTLEVDMDSQGKVLASIHQQADDDTPSRQGSMVQVWNLPNPSYAQEMAPQWAVEFPAEEVRSIAVAPEGDRIAFGRSSSERGAFATIIRSDSPDAPQESLPVAGAISAVEFSPNGSRLAICLEEGELLIVDSTTAEVLATNASVREGITDLAWHPSGDRLAGVDREIVTLWDAEAREVLKLRSDERIGDYPFDACLSFSSDGRKLASTQWNNTINVWSSADYKKRTSQETEAIRRPSSSELAFEGIQAIQTEDPENPWLLATRGYLQSLEGNLVAAQSDYRHAKQLLTGDEECLFIDSQAYIQVPSLPVDLEEGYTMEAWVKQWNSIQVEAPCGVIAAQYPKGPDDYYAYLAFQERPDLDRSGLFWLRLPVKQWFPSAELTASWTHVATMLSHGSRSLLVNGKIVEQRIARPGRSVLGQHQRMSDFYIGTTEFQDPLVKGRGLMRSIRVSRGLRYDLAQSFEPTRELEVDEQTLLLFDFEKDSAASSAGSPRIKDLSGHENHGILHHGWWLLQENEKPSR